MRTPRRSIWSPRTRAVPCSPALSDSLSSWSARPGAFVDGSTPRWLAGDVEAGLTVRESAAGIWSVHAASRDGGLGDGAPRGSDRAGQQVDAIVPNAPGGEAVVVEPGGQAERGVPGVSDRDRVARSDGIDAATLA